MQTDEKQAMLFLNHFKELIEKIVPLHQGEIIQYYGDAVLLTFDSSKDGVDCSISLQEALIKEEVPIRIGIHLGDVIFKNDNVFGDGVNIASRIESMGIPGAVLVSKVIRDQISNKSEFQLTSLGSFEFKNVKEPIEVFAMANEGLVVPSRADLKGKGKQAEPKKSKWQFLAAVVLIVVGLISAGFYFLSGEGSKKPLENDFGIKSTIAVFPFDVKGTAEIQYLGEGIVDLISTQLDEIPTLRSVDPNVLISRLGRETSGPKNPESLAKIASNLGAGKFILGSIIELGETLQFSASKYSIDGQKIITQTIKADQRNTLPETIDELIKNLVAEELNETGFEMGSLGAMTSNNLESLKYYLKGEQAYRNSQSWKAEGLLKQAVELDSTFALAWLRLGQAGQSMRWVNSDVAHKNWSKYVHRMPQKWQDYYNTSKGYGPALNKHKRLAERYDQTAEFVAAYGDYLYYGSPYFGGSCTEGKPYYLKALELDPNNQRHINTLTKIAVIESDSAAIQHYLSLVDSTFGFYGYLKLAELMFMDTVTDQQIQAFMDVYGSKMGWLYVTHQLPENEVVNLDLIERLLEVRPDPFSTLAYKEIMFGSQGREKELYRLFQNSPIVFGQDVQWYGRCLPATFMGNDGFAPYSEYYDSLYIKTKDGKTPWELYAAIKYALALNLPEEAKELKNKLRLLGNDEALNMEVRYYDFSVQAFEARLAGNDDLALTHIDSAYQYMFAPFWIEGMASRFDKTIMAANIYANKGDYEKAISLYNPAQYGAGFPTFRGYATYQLSNWFEQIGDRENALIKCNFFLDSYKNCDEKYRPLVEEVKDRRDRLIARMN
jgi:tetratricopeptide (TPR) repeat protein